MSLGLFVMFDRLNFETENVQLLLFSSCIPFLYFRASLCNNYFIVVIIVLIFTTVKLIQIFVALWLKRRDELILGRSSWISFCFGLAGFCSLEYMLILKNPFKHLQQDWLRKQSPGCVSYRWWGAVLQQTHTALHLRVFALLLQAVSLSSWQPPPELCNALH